MPESVIVRLPNWLGDTVMAVPAIRALRQALDGERLLLAGPWAAVLGDQALADVLVTYPRSWSGRLSTADTVRGFGGTTAVLLPTSLEAAASALYWGARRRIGFAMGGRRWLLTDPVPLPEPRLHQVDEYARLVERLGVAVDVRAPRLEPPAAASPERRRVRALMREALVQEPVGAARRVGVHLGAAYGSAKVWDPACVVELCRLLGSRGTTVVLLGAASDVPFVEAVGRATRAPSLAGRDGPELLPALLAAATIRCPMKFTKFSNCSGTGLSLCFDDRSGRLRANRSRTAVPAVSCKLSAVGSGATP